MQAYQGLPGNVQALPWQTNKTFVIYLILLTVLKYTQVYRILRKCQLTFRNLRGKRSEAHVLLCMVCSRSSGWHNLL